MLLSNDINDIFIILIGILLVFLISKWFSINEKFYINMSTRFTRNQSYDLRGDPFRIPSDPNLSPWGMSSWGAYPRYPMYTPMYVPISSAVRPYVV